MIKVFKLLRLTQWSIYPKLVVSLLTVIVPILIIGLYINQTSESIVSNEISLSMSSKVHFYLNAFETEIDRLNRLKVNFINDGDLQTLSVAPEAFNTYERQKAIIDMIKKLNFFKTSSPYVENIKLYIPRLGRSLLANSYDDTIPDDELKAISESARNGIETTYWNGELLLSQAYPTMTDKPLFVMEVALSNSQILQALASITNSSEGGALLFNPQAQWSISDGKHSDIEKQITSSLYDSKSKNELDISLRITINKKGYLVTLEHSDVLNMTLALYEPEELILTPLETYKKWFWLLSLLSILLVGLFSYWNYRQIHTPMQRMVRAFQKVENGDFGVSIKHWNNDEFNFMYMQFNSMVSRINKLISEVYEQKIRLQRSELKQLQLQINPHFLYNRYYALYRLAESEEIEKVKKYTKHLGDYFRFITRSADDEVTLEAEMEHAKTYVNIEMFSSRMETQVGEISEDCKFIVVPRLILQPIIENAYHHGLEHKIQQGIVKISFINSYEALSILIEDNGDDLSDEALNYLQTALDERGAQEMTGMLNVHRRLQLKFTTEYGLHLSRSHLGGLCVELRIPIPKGEYR